MSLQLNFTAGQIAGIINAEIIGNSETIITGINRIENVKNGELTFYSDSKYSKFLKDVNASCIIVPKDFNFEINENISLLKVDNPYFAIISFLKYLDNEQPKLKSYIHPTSIIHETAKIDNSVYIGPNCFIGENSVIEQNTVLFANVTLYQNVKIGSNTYLHAGVICCDDTIIGNDCIIHPGAVIGSDGFGYLENKDGSYEKIPQLGNVIIGNRVDIGSNTTIDRAMIGSTIIEDGVKIDNLCQIGHNVKIGENTGVVSQTGIAGSCNVGKRNRLGGQVGLAGHLQTADDVIIYAQSGVARTVEKKGAYFGSPIKERLHAFKIEAALNQLPELLKDVEKLKKEKNG